MDRECVEPVLATATGLGVPPFSIRTETGDIRSCPGGIPGEAQRPHLGVLRRAPRQRTTDCRVVAHAVGGGGEHATGTHQDAADTPTTFGEGRHFRGALKPALVARGAELGRARRVIPGIQMHTREVVHTLYGAWLAAWTHTRRVGVRRDRAHLRSV